MQGGAADALTRFSCENTVLGDPHARFVEVKQQVATTLIDKTHIEIIGEEDGRRWKKKS